jgi:hypothetical protein
LKTISSPFTYLLTSNTKLMNLNDDNIASGNAQQPENNTKPTGSRVDDGAGLDEKDLERSFIFGKDDDPANPTEGKATGGQNFGKENLTPAGNDKNNPTQMAGHTNAYFDRTEPSEEHPEDSNFTAENQDGAPDYDKAQPYAKNMESADPKPKEVKRGDGENDRPHEQEPYTEGTDDNDSGDNPNIPGPNELSDQQKVGEDEVESDK